MPREKEILVPVETYTREFDAKFLLSCFLASRGLRVVVGSRVDMHLHIADFNPSVYFAKDFRKPSYRILSILKQMGAKIAALDEEGVVFPNPDFYYRNRIDARTFDLVDRFMTWGPIGHEILAKAPTYKGGEITSTGSPRTDVLTTRFVDLYRREVNHLKDTYGDYLLINTNFGSINHFVSGEKKVTEEGEGAMAQHPDPETAAYWQHRFEVFKTFREIVPRMARDFPDRTIVLRPHPAEGHGLWQEFAKQHSNLVVLHEGSIVPWLAACVAVIHNGCTTAVEGHLLGRPVFSYCEARSDAFDENLPNDVSQLVTSYEALVGALRAAVASQGRLEPTSAQEAIVGRHFQTPYQGSASERIADILEVMAKGPASPTSSISRARAKTAATVRKWEKSLLSLRRDHKNSQSYNDKRFPPLSLAQAKEKLAVLAEIEPRFGSLTVRESHKKIFELTQG